MKQLSLLILSLGVLAGCAEPTASRMPSPPPASHPQMESTQLQMQVAFHQERVANDPEGAIGWALYAESLLSYSGEKDDDEAAVEAEKAARKSLKIRTSRNSRAAVLLAKSLLAQHRFQEAHQAAVKARSLDPNSFPVRRLELETLMELGRYAEVKKGISILSGQDDPAAASVKARWAGISGSPQQEVDLLTKAADEVDSITALPASVVSWYRVQLGSALFRAGQMEEAQAQADLAVSFNPQSYQAAALQARLAAGLGNWETVLEWAAKTKKIANMTDIEGLAVEALIALGRKSEAEAKLIEIAAANLQPGQSLNFARNHHHGHSTETRHTHDRLFAMALADLGRHTQFAHHAAEEDLDNRRDIYALDAFAWTTYRYWQLTPPSVTGEGDGLLREAEKAIEGALATGSKDPKILFHAGMIFRHAQPKRGAELLASALRINPQFHATQAEMASEALRKLTQPERAK